MNILDSTQQKHFYCSPKIEHIKLDNEISLALESQPPTGPSESIFKVQEYFITNPLSIV